MVITFQEALHQNQGYIPKTVRPQFGPPSAEGAVGRRGRFRPASCSCAATALGGASEAGSGGGEAGRSCSGLGRAGGRWRRGACPGPEVMFGRSGYRALPLGDFDRFQQSSFGFLGSQKGCLSPEPGGVGPGAGEWLPSTVDRIGTSQYPHTCTPCL